VTKLFDRVAVSYAGSWGAVFVLLACVNFGWCVEVVDYGSRSETGSRLQTHATLASVVIGLERCHGVAVFVDGELIQSGRALIFGVHPLAIYQVLIVFLFLVFLILLLFFTLLIVQETHRFSGIICICTYPLLCDSLINSALTTMLRYCIVMSLQEISCSSRISFDDDDDDIDDTVDELVVV